MRQNNYEYDAFISHAVEDKIPIANELCARLEAQGLRIWYSGKELGVGDSIEKTIEKGLNRSRYGIVIFSPTYLSKNWTIREFYTLLAKEIEHRKVILPVLYNVTPEDLKRKDLLMADRFAVNADKGIDVVVERLVREIKKTNVVKETKQAWLSRIWFFLFLSLLANVGFLLRQASPVGEYFPAPRQSFQPVRYVNDHRPTGETLFSEMRGLLDQFSYCDCDHRQQRPGQSFQKISAVYESTADNSGPQPAKEAHSGSATGKKMTMAVVFQIETSDSGSPARSEQDVAEMLNTISLADTEETPFLTVKTVGQQSSLHKDGCAHRNPGH